MHSVLAEFSVELDVATRQITVRRRDPMPCVSRVAQVDWDIVGAAMNDVQVAPGPFACQPVRPTRLLEGIPEDIPPVE